MELDAIDHVPEWVYDRLLTVLDKVPSAQPELAQNLHTTCTDAISRQTAISAICNACGKIDCDKMDKCEKLQLPPANSSEIPNNSDTISRQAAIDAFWKLEVELRPSAIDAVWDMLKNLPSAQPEIIRCKDCKYWREDHTCKEHSLVSPMLANDFCSRAERRTDE